MEYKENIQPRYDAHEVCLDSNLIKINITQNKGLEQLYQHLTFDISG